MGENTLNEHFYKPALGASGAAEKDLFDAKLDRLDVLFQVDCANYDHPDDAITAIDTDNKTLIVTEAETCDTNFTVPANVTVKFERGGKWTINTGITVTFNGQIDAGLWQIFSYTGTGTLNFGVEATEKVYPQWWGAIANGTTDCSPAIVNAILSLPSTGGMVYLVAGTYRCNSSITFPIDTGIIKNIRIQGESSGLACGAAENVYGTRINSYIAGGNLFDLYTDTPECVNVQFRDFECYDMEATGVNYGIKAYKFRTGCIVENVGFKTFTSAIHITNFCYYSKFDRVASFYARSFGIFIEGANGVLFNRIQCSNGDSIGLYLKASTTHLRGVTVLNSWFEGNNDKGIYVLAAANYYAAGINIIGNYFEQNSNVTDHHASLQLTGTNATDTILSGTIIGNYFSELTYSRSIRLDYAKNVLVQGNRVFAYYSNTCIFSANCVDCNFISNAYDSTPTTPLDVPADNYYIEPGLDKTKLPKLVSKVITIADGDATPDISDGNIFTTSSNTAATEITDLDLPTVGQMVTLVGGSDNNSSTITDGGNFNLDGNITLGLDISITLFIQADNDYIEMCRNPITSRKLSDFAATTSAELAGVISDKTGTGALVFGTAPTLTNPTIKGTALTLEDDIAASFTPVNTSGILYIYNNNLTGVDTTTEPIAIINYDLIGTVGIASLYKTANVELATGILEGTTGTDAKFTISVHTDGKIYVENRLGATKYIAHYGS